MKISTVAANSGCNLETIRYYERIGLMPLPERTPKGYREYSEADVEQLRFISRGRGLGFSLQEIRSLLRLAQDPGISCSEVDQLARKHLDDILVRLKDLQRMARELERTIDHCGGGQRGECTILDSLRQPTT
mgnify:FL=1